MKKTSKRSAAKAPKPVAPARKAAPKASKPAKARTVKPATKAKAKTATKTVARSPMRGSVRYVDPPGSRDERIQQLAGLRDLLHDESEADEDGFIKGGGFDRYGGFEGDGLS